MPVITFQDTEYETGADESVLDTLLRHDVDLYYRAGQYINIRMPIGQIRSYSLASLPAQDDYLELHIKRMENGQVSNWLLDDVQIGDDLDFRGPYGDCFYLPENRYSDMLMIGTGTGLAPLYGLLRDALHSGHRGEVNLYHGVRDVADLYLDDSLREIASRHKNVRYHACASALCEPCSGGVSAGRAADIALANAQLQKDMLVYLCGSPEMVNSTRKQAYLRDVDLKHIYADPVGTWIARCRDRLWQQALV